MAGECSEALVRQWKLQVDVVECKRSDGDGHSEARESEFR